MQATTFNPATNRKTVAVNHGSRVEVAHVDATGYIARLWFTFPGWFWQHWQPDRPVNQSILKTLILHITFDGAPHPQVSVPAADLVGVGLAQAGNFAAEYLGMSSGGFYVAFPMPFRTSFKIEFENCDPTVDTEVFLNVLYQVVEALDEGTPYFHAHFHTGRCLGPEPFSIVSVQGTGRYVGCTVAMQGEDLNYLSFLEAPEHVFVDEDWDRPRLIGTGLEDYFLGGWYFREGTVIGPNHGVTFKDALRSSVSMYRIHAADAIWFQHRFRLDFASPWDAERLRPFRWSSASYLYLDHLEAAPEVPAADRLLCWLRTANTDHQAIP